VRGGRIREGARIRAKYDKTRQHEETKQDKVKHETATAAQGLGLGLRPGGVSRKARQKTKIFLELGKVDVEEEKTTTRQYTTRKQKTRQDRRPQGKTRLDNHKTRQAQPQKTRHTTT
jgi:hypothetical protein